MVVLQLGIFLAIFHRIVYSAMAEPGTRTIAQ